MTMDLLEDIDAQVEHTTVEKNTLTEKPALPAPPIKQKIVAIIESTQITTKMTKKILQTLNGQQAAPKITCQQ